MRWVLLFVVSCASAPAARPTPPSPLPAPENARTNGVDLLEGNRLMGPVRPHGVRQPFDLDAVPRAVWGAPNPKVHFALTTRTKPADVSFEIRVRGFEVAELDLPRNDFTASTGRFFSGTPPTCGETRWSPAYWTGLHTRTWTDDGLEVELGRGTFDHRSCTTSTEASVRVLATAIVKALVYAARVREANDGREALWLFMPRGMLASASGDPSALFRTANAGVFTRLTLPLDDRRSASAAVRIGPASMALWQRLRTGAPGNADDSDPPSACTLVSVDVIRQGDVTTASISVAPSRFATWTD